MHTETNELTKDPSLTLGQWKSFSDGHGWWCCWTWGILTLQPPPPGIILSRGPRMPLHMPMPSVHLCSSPKPFLNRRYGKYFFFRNWQMGYGIWYDFIRTWTLKHISSWPWNPPLSFIHIFSRFSILGHLEGPTMFKPNFSCTCGFLWGLFITQILKPALDFCWVS